MGELPYKPLYAFAKRENGVYRIARFGPGGEVDVFDTPQEAENEYRNMGDDMIVVDIGLIVDKNIPRPGKFLDVSDRVKKRD